MATTKTKTKARHALGWKPSVKDIRDYRLRFASTDPVAVEVDLWDTGFMPDIWDQDALGSCVPNGVERAYSFDLEKQGGTDNFIGSRLFVYYNGRDIEGTISEDSGLTITDGVKALNQYGTPPETDWPYVISKFKTKPPAKAYTNGKLRVAAKYARVTQTQLAMQQCLTAGYPIVIGFSVYESFESAAVAMNGIVPMPKKSEQLLGGHCVVVTGYKMISGLLYWICDNSWGEGWGDKGRFYMPVGYLTNSNLADDFWVIQAVTSPDPTPTPPTPDPTPTPIPVPPAPTPVPPTPSNVDVDYWASIKDWAFARHVTSNKRAAKAAQAWAKVKGLL